MAQSGVILSTGATAPLGRELTDDPFCLVHAVLDGKYFIEAVEASGGASIVYRALHLLWGRPVAIKAFNPPGHLTVAERIHFFEAFMREGALSAELSERSLTVRQAHDAGSAVAPSGDRVFYLVLEWLEGEPLDLQLVARRAAGLPALSLPAAMDLVSPVASALSMAHDKGICHLDVKPANLFVLSGQREPPDIKLIDFGVAKVFAPPSPGRDEPAQFRSFTPGYGAPEQFDPGLGPTGPWTDVFALALILVELVTGHSPLKGATPDEMARAAVDARERPTPRTYGVPVSDPVERVFSRSLVVDPMKRFATVGSFWRALDTAAAGDDLVYPLPLRRRRASADVPEHRGRRVESPSARGPRRRASVVRSVAVAAILATVALAAACVAEQLGWHVTDAARIMHQLVP